LIPATTPLDGRAGFGERPAIMKPTKISILREFMAAGQWREAIKLAASFPRLGDERGAILSARGAFTNPSFYRQIGKDPEALIAAGRDALTRRYQ